LPGLLPEPQGVWRRSRLKRQAFRGKAPGVFSFGQNRLLGRVFPDSRGLTGMSV
jgi:hypothetical protein